MMEYDDDVCICVGSSWISKMPCKKYAILADKFDYIAVYIHITSFILAIWVLCAGIVCDTWQIITVCGAVHFSV